MPPLQFPMTALIRQQANIVDENYSMIGNIEESLRLKIINHEYVDFARLIPKDRLGKEEDHRMELISRGGSTFFVPVSDRESANNVISHFSKWEQAFRVFSNIYSGVYPERGTELIQYNHLIYTASLSFIWENVYRYDKEFRIHMSNYPHRNWSVILQQAWSLYLKDRISHNHFHHDDKGSPGSGNSSYKKKEICKKFNKGKCTRGLRCHFEHRCLICGKFGHGAHICRSRDTATNSVTPAGGNVGNATKQ